ncbi:RDD family protein [Halococcus agarilyticus]|uniref:RDD family protein n=1 Tax=Halococcus agarilyticus TaxID=1232219 RepID=UPI000677B474|nr:RDD family protein [Halococcus agarilyticus]
MDSVALRLFGVVHLDRPGKVTTELREYAGDVDALFIEYPEEDPSWTTYGRCLLKAPVFFFGLVLNSLLQMPLFVLLNRGMSPLLSTEMSAARRLSDERDVALYRVDDHPLFTAADSPWTWIVANWGVAAGLGVLRPRSVLTTAALLLAAWLVVSLPARYAPSLGSLFGAVVPWFAVGVGFRYGFLSLPVVAAFFLAFVAVVKRTLSERNRHMLRRIEAISSENGHERVCLITGKAHLSGLVRLASDTGISITRSRASKWLRRSDDERADPEPSADDGSVFANPDPREPLDPRTLPVRTGAALIDLVVVGVLALPMAIVGGAISEVLLGSIPVGLLVGALSTPVVYGFVLEAAFGRTIGKRLRGLVVVATDGSRCSARSAAVRNLLRIVDFPPFYLVGFVVAALTRRQQRLGDLAAGTVVTRTDS